VPRNKQDRLKILLKVFLAPVFLLMTMLPAAGQQHAGDIKQGNQAETDTVRLKRLLEEAGAYYFNKPDSCVLLTKEALDLSRKLDLPFYEVQALNMSGEALRFLGDFPQALDMQFKALQINRREANRYQESVTLGFIGYTYTEFNEFRLALDHLLLSKKIRDSIMESGSLSDPFALSVDSSITFLVLSSFTVSNIGNAYEGMNMPDSALYYQQMAQQRIVNLKQGNLKSLILTRLGIVYAKQEKYEEALQYYRDALNNAYQIGDKVNPSKTQHRMAEAYYVLREFDSSLYFSRRAFIAAQESSQKLQLLSASNMLVKLFRHLQLKDSIIYYQEISMALKDSIFGPEKFRQLQLLTLREQQHQQKILNEQEQYRNRIRLIALASALFFLLTIALLLYRNNRHKQKANLLLQAQKKKIQETLNKLTATQKQLVQSEKMASLGELTAGVAHEIQNPLNFVNNFSDINNELLEDLKDAAKKVDMREIEKITEQLKENESKINFHGKRADAIVKNMLQHSRNGSAVKEPVDINKLIDEYVRLSFHGMRAKIKTFNAELDLEYDPAIGKINIIQQDIGRVLLNLLNNAFYAVHEKQKSAPANYTPTITVTTALISSGHEPGKPGTNTNSDNNIRISIKDNGTGIPDKIREKIFQPFFTTKPTGEGTGLGLSLSYDIITKGHGGELNIESETGEYTIFIIEIPI
jgi:signal transduction histidine kinase